MSQLVEIPAKPRAYSYVRFSTPEQMKGDSFRRQYQKAVEYAARKGLELDDTFRFEDLGVSGYRGANLATGALSCFREAVLAGEIPQGSYLLVESLDRISRQQARRAQRALEEIVDLGVTVVTLSDGREYSSESLDRDPFEMVISLLTFIRANEESATKADRLKQAWAAKRSRAALEGQPLTSLLPAWLRLSPDRQSIEVDKDRAAIVLRIFKETRDGKGQNLIAHAFNAEGVKPWGRGRYWHRSYIQKILASEAVIGTFTPHTLDYVEGKRTRTPQAPVKDYFPAVIPPELWSDVQAMSNSRGTGARGRHAARPVTHMLAQLATCPLCGGTMTRVTKGKRSRPAYVCVRAKTRAGCTYRSVRVELVEEAIIERLPERLRDAPAGDRDAEIDRQIENTGGKLEAVQRRIDRVLSAIEDGGDNLLLSERLRVLEAEFGGLRDVLRDLEARRVDVAGQTVQARIQRLIGTLAPEDGTQLDVAAVNAAMRGVFKQVTVDYPHGVLEFRWGHGGSVELPYALSLQ